MELVLVAPEEGIPGSYWGESEAGLRGDRLYARLDTPVHSMLHEACHYICMTPERRSGLDRDAGGDDPEESAVCYLQVLLADELPGVGRQRLWADMGNKRLSLGSGQERPDSSTASAGSRSSPAPETSITHLPRTKR